MPRRDGLRSLSRPVAGVGGRMAHESPGWTRRGGRAALALAAAALAASSVPARAAPLPPGRDGPDGRFDVRLGLLRFDYEERDPLTNAFLDGEEGFVPSLTLEGELRAERVFGRAMLRLAKGSVDYDGHVQSTNPNFDGLPLRTTTNAGFVQGEVQVGAFLDAPRRVALFAGLGLRRWSRSIQGATATGRDGTRQPISGLDE